MNQRTALHLLAALTILALPNLAHAISHYLPAAEGSGGASFRIG